MVIFTPKWQEGQFDPTKGTFVPEQNKACAQFSPDKAIDGWVKIQAAPNAPQLNSINVFYLSHSGNMVEIENMVTEILLDDDILSQAQLIYVNVVGDITINQTPDIVMPAMYNFVISEYYFLESSLQMYITAQQLDQFKYMYPRCVQDAYRSACGKLTAQIGNRFDMDAMLGETDELKKDDTICWILQVLTAYFICSPTMNISSTLEDANREVTSIIGQLKGGQVSLEEPAPYRNDDYSARPVIVSKRNKYIG